MTYDFSVELLLPNGGRETHTVMASSQEDARKFCEQFAKVLAVGEGIAVYPPLNQAWFTTAEAACYLRVSTKTVYRAVDDGELSRGRYGLFSRADLDRLAASEPKAKERAA